MSVWGERGRARASVPDRGSAESTRTATLPAKERETACEDCAMPGSAFYSSIQTAVNFIDLNCARTIHHFSAITESVAALHELEARGATTLRIHASSSPSG